MWSPYRPAWVELNLFESDASKITRNLFDTVEPATTLY